MEYNPFEEQEDGTLSPEETAENPAMSEAEEVPLEAAFAPGLQFNPTPADTQSEPEVIPVEEPAPLTQPFDLNVLEDPELDEPAYEAEVPTQMADEDLYSDAGDVESPADPEMEIAEEEPVYTPEPTLFRDQDFRDAFRGRI